MASSFAPGRVELLGNHTDYNGGVVLSAAIDLGISATGQLREDGRIALASEGLDGVVTVDAQCLVPTGNWTDYALGVARVLQEAGIPIAGFEAKYSSTLPLGAGLSSSAAMEVSTAMLLGALYGLAIEPLALAKLCRKAENEFVGVSCGLLDQVSSIFGREDHAIFLDCRAETVETIPFPAGVAFLIVHSGVKHALSGGEYNERRDQCFEAARLMGVPALRDATPAQLAATAMPDLVKRRAAHIVGENERVFAAVDHLRAGDAAAFGELMFQSHESSQSNFENSTRELDSLVAIARRQQGVLGARLTGGGFGGAIVALVEASRIKAIGDAVVAEYGSETGHKGTAYACKIGAGAVARG